MEKITVNKDELLEQLRQNRQDHRQVFEEALDGFKRETIEELEAMLTRLRAGHTRSVHLSKPVPQDHTGDYNRAIAMIEMSIGDTVTLSEDDFAQYVMDDWGWQRQFLSNVYASSTAKKKFSDRYEVS